MDGCARIDKAPARGGGARLPLDPSPPLLFFPISLLSLLLSLSVSASVCLISRLFIMMMRILWYLAVVLLVHTVVEAVATTTLASRERIDASDYANASDLLLSPGERAQFHAARSRHPSPSPHTIVPSFAQPPYDSPFRQQQRQEPQEPQEPQERYHSHLQPPPPPQEPHASSSPPTTDTDRTDEVRLLNVPGFLKAGDRTQLTVALVSRESGRPVFRHQLAGLTLAFFMEPWPLSTHATQSPTESQQSSFPPTTQPYFYADLQPMDEINPVHVRNAQWNRASHGVPVGARHRIGTSDPNGIYRARMTFRVPTSLPGGSYAVYLLRRGVNVGKVAAAAAGGGGGVNDGHSYSERLPMLIHIFGRHDVRDGIRAPKRCATAGVAPGQCEIQAAYIRNSAVVAQHHGQADQVAYRWLQSVAGARSARRKAILWALTVFGLPKAFAAWGNHTRYRKVAWESERWLVHNVPRGDRLVQELRGIHYTGGGRSGKSSSSSTSMSTSLVPLLQRYGLDTSWVEQQLRNPDTI